ncbi:MAG: PAS domain-containing protein [Sporichthyaceae bacterium]
MAARPTRNSARVAAILDHLPDALLLVDPTGTVVNANARALEAFRAPGAAEPLIGRLLVDVLPGFGEGSDRLARRRSGSVGRTPTERMFARALDGSTFPVELYRALVPWAGSGDHMLLVLHEVSEVPVSSEPVRSSQQAQAVLRATQEGLCGVDRDGQVVLANPAAARLLGAKVADIAGKNLHTLALHTGVDGSPTSFGDSAVGEALRTGRRTRRRREVLWRADGSPVPVEVTASPIIEGTEIVGAIAAFTDITRAVEEERRRHRLVDILSSDVGPRLDALAAQVPAAAAEQVRELRALVAAAVDYETLMTGQITLSPAPAEIADVVQSAVESTAGAARARGVIVELVLEAAPVIVDAVRLAPAVAELIRSAVASAAPASSIAVTASAVGDRVRVGVRQSRVADGSQENPLLRWLRGGLSNERGPDPDLAFVQIVVERHGGRFLLDSAGPSGTRSYTIELPAASAPDAPLPAAPNASNSTPVAAVPPLAAAQPAPQADPAPPEPAAAVPVSAGAVLMWPGAGVGLGSELEQLGWSTATAGAGAEGLAAAVAGPDGDAPAALLIDPSSGPVGRRSLSQLRARAAAAKLPLVVATGLVEAPSAEIGQVADPGALIEALGISTQSGQTRVLLIEDDTALAGALGAGLLRHGMHAVYARNSTEAIERAEMHAPDLVLLGVANGGCGGGGSGPDIVEWLGRSGRLSATPVLAYTTDALAPDHQSRLERGQTVPAVEMRAVTPDAEADLASLIARVATARKLRARTHP